MAANRERKSPARSPKKRIYCGDQTLPSGYKAFGTRFRCLQMGFGVGTMLEQKALKEGKTKTKIGKYTPKKIYCGYKPPSKRPSKYTSTGSRNTCLKRGVGAGIYTEHRKYVEDPENYFDNMVEYGDSKRSEDHASGGDDTDRFSRYIQLRQERAAEFLQKHPMIVNADGHVDGHVDGHADGHAAGGNRRKRSKKHERCIRAVKAKQTTWCNSNNFPRDKGCYNPWAICSRVE